MTESDNQSRIKSLDTLRGIAILMVLLAHYVSPTLDKLNLKAGYLLGSFGGGGVILFFILSGYLIYKTRRGVSATIFLSRRLWKIFPAYFLACLVALLLKYLTCNHLPSWQEIVCNLTLTQDIFHHNMFCNVFWTLLIEIKFYFIMMAFGGIIGLFPDVLFALALTLVNSVVYLHVGKGSHTVTFMPAFFVGLSLYRYKESKWSKRHAWDFFATLIVSSIGIYLFLQENRISNSIFLIGITLLFILILSFQWDNVLFSKFGEISYSLYLYHAILGYFLIDLISVQYGINPWLILLIVTAVVFALSYLSYRVIEKPFVIIGRHFELFSVK